MRTLKSIMCVSLMAVLCFGLVSCDKKQRNEVRDAAVKSISAAGAGFTASALDCSEESVIQSDYKKELRKLKIFEREKKVKELVVAKMSGGDQKALGLICSTAARAVVPVLVGEGLKKIPDSWGCTAETFEDGLTAFADGICANL